MHASFQSQDKRSGAPLVAAQASPLGQHLFFMLTQVEHEFRTRLQRALRQVELDIRQYSTLAYIAGGHLPTQHELADLLHLDPSQIVTLTKALAARGLLVRQTAPHDRRARVLVITTEGKRLYQRAAVLVQRVEEALTASLSRRDCHALKNLLDRTLPLS